LEEQEKLLEEEEQIAKRLEEEEKTNGTKLISTINKDEINKHLFNIDNESLLLNANIEKEIEEQIELEEKKEKRKKRDQKQLNEYEKITDELATAYDIELDKNRQIQIYDNKMADLDTYIRGLEYEFLKYQKETGEEIQALIGNVIRYEEKEKKQKELEKKGKRI